jgi:methionyl-tRNA formyltransferase
MRVIFLGTPEIAVPTLRALASAPEFKPQLVMTQPDARRSRRGGAEPSPVARASAELGLPCEAVENVSTGEAFARLLAAAPDIIVVVAFGQLLKQRVLDLPRHGCINLHPSSLPKYRGAAPVQRAVMEGVVESGLTVMQLVRKMDAGPILLQRPWRMDTDKDAAELLAEAAGLGAPMILEVLRHIDTMEARPQDESAATFAPLLEKSDGELHFARTANELHNRIRAVQPWPKAEAWVEREAPVRVIVRRASVTQGHGAPGSVLAVTTEGIVVACGDGALLLREIQLEGKPVCPARDVANGLRLHAGEKFRT